MSLLPRQQLMQVGCLHPFPRVRMLTVELFSASAVLAVEEGPNVSNMAV